MSNERKQYTHHGSRSTVKSPDSVSVLRDRVLFRKANTDAVSQASVLQAHPEWSNSRVGEERAAERESKVDVMLELHGSTVHACSLLRPEQSTKSTKCISPSLCQYLTSNPVYVP